MKTNKKLKIWGSLVTVGLTASCAFAQQAMDSDALLKTLDGTAETTPTATAETTPAAVVAVAVTTEKETQAVVAEVKKPEGSVDDLGMKAIGDGTAEATGELISVRLSKVGLEEAISLFAQLSGANIIVPELTEAAQISVNLKDVEWRPALQSILDSYNYELYQKVAGSNVYSVRQRSAGAPEPQVVETFLLRYATVPNAAKLVRELLPENAKVSEFASRNMIIVKSSESSLGEIRTVLEAIDTVRQQVFIESKFMELSDGAQKDLGIDWKQLGIDETGAGGLGVSAGAHNLTYADGRQVSTGNPIFDPVANFSEHIFTSVLDVDQFQVVLNALASTRGVNVVSNPKIIVANEEHANISIVRKEPNLKQDRQQALNDTPDTITFQMDPDMPFFEYGIKLDVIPSINTSSNITVSIKPSLTRKFGDKSAGENNSYPIIDEKTVETTFNLASGQTAAIGGLTEVTDSEKERHIPLLGSIPYLGRLFSWSQTVSDQTETIIFVTVGLANTQDIGLETGLPEDSELARRRLIRDRNMKALKEHARKYYETEESDNLNDSIKELDQNEAERIESRKVAAK